MSKPNHPRAESYLIRLWRDSDHGPWRASLRNIRSGEVRHFACPEALWACLQEDMAGQRVIEFELDNRSKVKERK